MSALAEAGVALSITVPDLSDLYRDVVVSHLSQSFPANLTDRGNVLDSVTAALIATSKIRYGPPPGPESLVALRRVIANALEFNEPLPILVPWGGKKPHNGYTVDVADLYGLKTLECLHRRITPFHAPGIRAVIRVEDVNALYMFGDERGTEAAVERYSSDFTKLVDVLDMRSFIEPRRERDVMPLAAYVATAERARVLLEEYITHTDLFGFSSYDQLPSYKALVKLGWKGIIPVEQRGFYHERYARLYPNDPRAANTHRLAMYLAGSLARYNLGGSMADGFQGRPYITLNFTPAVPGMPKDMADNRVYYRTMPESFTRTHIAPWRAHGYLKIAGSEVTPKITNWTDPLPIETGSVEFSRAGQTVAVHADRVVES